MTAGARGKGPRKGAKGKVGGPQSPPKYRCASLSRCPCRWNATCHVERQRLQQQVGTFGMGCETFVAIETKRAFHPEPVETESKAPF